PLSDDLPGFLSPGAVAAPTVGIKLLVFVSESCFKGTAVQVERHHIRGGKGTLGQIGPEEFIHNSVPDNPDLPFLLLRWSRMARDNDTNERAILGEVLVWTVVKRAADPTFCTVHMLISRQVQASLDVRAIQHRVVFATGDIRAIGHIRD